MSDITIDYIDAIRLKAMRAALDPDAAAWFRSVMRWYSKEFSTPLHQVEDLNVEDILVAYFEEHYSQLKDGDEHQQMQLDKILQELTETAEERESRKKQEEQEEAQTQQILKMAEEEAQKAKEKGNILAKKEEPEPNTKEPPEIAVKFDSNLLDEVGDSDPISAPPPGKKR